MILDASAAACQEGNLVGPVHAFSSMQQSCCCCSVSQEAIRAQYSCCPAFWNSAAIAGSADTEILNTWITQGQQQKRIRKLKAIHPWAIFTIRADGVWVYCRCCAGHRHCAGAQHSSLHSTELGAAPGVRLGTKWEVSLANHVRGKAHAAASGLTGALRLRPDALHDALLLDREPVMSKV